jgi:hypothetical protein
MYGWVTNKPLFFWVCKKLHTNANQNQNQNSVAYSLVVGKQSSHSDLDLVE